MQECRYEYRSREGKTWTPWHLSAFTSTMKNIKVNGLRVEYRDI